MPEPSAERFHKPNYKPKINRTMEIIKTKNELKAMLAELMMNEYIIVKNEDEECFLNLARKIGLIVCGGDLTKEGRVFYIEL